MALQRQTLLAQNQGRFTPSNNECNSSHLKFFFCLLSFFSFGTHRFHKKKFFHSLEIFLSTTRSVLCFFNLTTILSFSCLSIFLLLMFTCFMLFRVFWSFVRTGLCVKAKYCFFFHLITNARKLHPFFFSLVVFGIFEFLSVSKQSKCFFTQQQMQERCTLFLWSFIIGQDLSFFSFILLGEKGSWSRNILTNIHKLTVSPQFT